MSRISRKNRTDLALKTSGGVFDLFDNTIKEVWSVNDEEYDFIIEDATDEELGLLINEEPTITEIKRTLLFIDSKLEELYKNK